MADKYGPIFMIKLGVKKAIVVSSHKMAKECLGINDRVFMDRPQTLFMEIVTYNNAMFGLARYSPYWRDLRKLTTVEFLSNHQVEMFKQVRISEIRSAMKELYAKRSMEPVDMKLWFNNVILNSTVTLIVGKPLKEICQGEKYNKMLKTIGKFFELVGAFVLADSLPFLRWFDIGGYEKAMKKVADEMDQVGQEWLDEHKKKTISEEGKDKEGFMDIMVRRVFEMEQDKPTKFGAETVIKAICMTFLAGTQSIAVTLIWALSLLLNNKEAMKKVQTEIDKIVGKARRVNESDIKDMIYLEAVLKETFRLYPPGPLSFPRESVEDCTVNNYHIPGGTQLFVNLYKIQRDPEVWPNPLEFRPERFLTTHKDYDVKGQNFAFTPFGSGRRICPGITFSMKFMMLTLATLLHEFEISTPSDEPVDTSASFGLTSLKTSPLDVILVPRLPENLCDPPPAVNGI
ncbi:hypothetical protein KSS87_013988 [Heliosperma pusillum]|nr:hypothetical protein KSS87_013988 [Heliosperma pusillum]